LRNRKLNVTNAQTFDTSEHKLRGRVPVLASQGWQPGHICNPLHASVFFFVVIYFGVVRAAVITFDLWCPDWQIKGQSRIASPPRPGNPDSQWACLCRCLSWII